MTLLQRVRSVLLPGLVGLLFVTACGGGAKENGVDKLSAQDALAKVKAALTKVTTVHVTGHISLGGKDMSLDLRDKSTGGTGTLQVAGGRIDLVRDNDVVYLKGDSTALQATGASSAQAALVAGKWIKASAGTSGGFGALGSLLDSQALFTNITTPTGTVSKGKRTTVNGKKAYTLVDKATDGNGTLYIALTGQPLPLRIDQPGPSGGALSFAYGEAVNVNPPSGAVDLSQVTGG